MKLLNYKSHILDKKVLNTSAQCISLLQMPHMVYDDDMIIQISIGTDKIKHACNKIMPFSVLFIDSLTCQWVLHLLSSISPLSSFNCPTISFFLAGLRVQLAAGASSRDTKWELYCNYHCPVIIIEHTDRTVVEGSFGSPDQKPWALIMEQKEKPKHCAKSRRNVPKRVQGNGQPSRSSSLAMTCWCQEHRCLGCVSSDQFKQRTERVSHAMMFICRLFQSTWKTAQQVTMLCIWKAQVVLQWMQVFCMNQ